MSNTNEPNGDNTQQNVGSKYTGERPNNQKKLVDADTEYQTSLISMKGTVECQLI